MTDRLIFTGVVRSSELRWSADRRALAAWRGGTRDTQRSDDAPARRSYCIYSCSRGSSTLGFRKLQSLLTGGVSIPALGRRPQRLGTRRSLHGAAQGCRRTVSSGTTRFLAMHRRRAPRCWKFPTVFRRLSLSSPTRAPREGLRRPCTSANIRMCSRSLTRDGCSYGQPWVVRCGGEQEAGCRHCG